MSDGCVDRELEDFFNPFHLFAAAFHVYGVHTLGNGLSLFRRHRCKSLCPQEINACTFIAEI